MELVRTLAAIERRGAGSDAERRAARVLSARLRALGRRDARIVPIWTRPARGAADALICLTALVGGLIAVGPADAGGLVVLAALLLYAGEVTGRAPILRRLTFERATQDVVSRSTRRDAAVRLVITAQTDTFEPGLLERGRGARVVARTRRALHGHLPGLHGWTLLAILLVAVCCAARAETDDVPGWLGVAQLVPTVGLLLCAACFLDIWGAKPSSIGASDATAPAAALALVAELDRLDLRSLAVDVVLAGAGGPGGLGLRAWARSQRAAGTKSGDVAVLHMAPCGSGRPVWWTREGPVFPLAAHPDLRRLAAELARRERGLRAAPVQSRAWSGARAARAAGWPGISIGALDDDGVVRHRGTADRVDDVDPATMDATIAFGVGLVVALDAHLSSRQLSRTKTHNGVPQPS